MQRISVSFRAVLSLALLGVVAAPVLHAQQPATDKHPTLEDLFQVAALGDLDMAPDGSRLLYTVRTTNLKENRTNADIWMLILRLSPEEQRRASRPPSQQRERPGQPALVRRGTATPPGTPPPNDLQLTRNPEDDTDPHWRPDGQKFGFLSERVGPDGQTGRAALYLMAPDGGEPELLYRHDTAIRAFAWSPDGTRIGFTADEPTSAADSAKGKAGRDVRFEDQAGPFRHLWVLNVASRHARRVASGDSLNVSGFGWSPDGQTLVFDAAPSPRIVDAWRSDVYTVASADSAVTPRRLTDNPGPDYSPEFSPDGMFIYYHTQQSQAYQIGYSRVYRIPAGGGRPEDMNPKLDLEASDYVFLPDGKAVYFEATTGTTRTVFYMPLDTRQPMRLSGDQGVFRDAAFSRDRSTMALVMESTSRPPEIAGGVLESKPEDRTIKNAPTLTNHNEIARKWAVGLTDVLRWKSSDGKEIEGLLVYPAGWTPARGPAPLVVKIHGGPSGVYVQNFQASSYGADAQRYAADGYAVFLPNPRGSSGYGEQSERSVIQDWGGHDFQDIMTGVDTLVARRIASQDSLGVMGWSYGGYMTAWIISQTNRFKAAVVGAGITETIAMWGTQDIVHVFEAYFGAGPWAPGAWETYQKSSPLAHLQDVKTPTLIIHGRNDPRVPPNQAMLLYRTLKAHNVPTDLMWLPRTEHGPREPGLQYETAKAQKAWMDRWIRHQETSDSVSEPSRQRLR